MRHLWLDLKSLLGRCVTGAFTKIFATPATTPTPFPKADDHMAAASTTTTTPSLKAADKTTAATTPRSSRVGAGVGDLSHSPESEAALLSKLIGMTRRKLNALREGHPASHAARHKAGKSAPECEATAAVSQCGGLMEFTHRGRGPLGDAGRIGSEATPGPLSRPDCGGRLALRAGGTRPLARWGRGLA